MGKTVISQLPLWHDHVYLQIVYIQFCCPTFNMKQMKEITSHGVHGFQHFLCGTCPIALFALFSPPGVLSASPAFFYVCAAVEFLSLPPTLLHAQLLPDHWIFIQTHLCTNSQSALHGVYALTVPRAPAAQWVRNLEQFFTSLKEEY